ncbi:MAG: peptide deformylase [Candidatus Daviesbacteria bacterium]|nr:peptide deformylase [Candidatus Daviesbacteria bacterium]
MLQGDALQLIKEKYTGYAARIFQHEVKHLNGKLFTFHITNPDHYCLLTRLQKRYNLLRALSSF